MGEVNHFEEFGREMKHRIDLILFMIGLGWDGSWLGCGGVGVANVAAME